MKHDINSPPSNSGSVAAINGKMLGAATMTGIGIWLWPNSALDWGWGVLAIFMWLSAFGLMIEVIRLSMKIHLRDRAVAKFTGNGNQPKSAELVSSDALAQAGMTDG